MNLATRAVGVLGSCLSAALAFVIAFQAPRAPMAWDGLVSASDPTVRLFLFVALFQLASAVAIFAPLLGLSFFAMLGWARAGRWIFRLSGAAAVAALGVLVCYVPFALTAETLSSRAGAEIATAGLVISIAAVIAYTQAGNRSSVVDGPA